MKRRILPMIMAVIMILSIIQVPAWAADESSPMETADGTELTDVGETDSGEGETEEAAKTLTEIFAEASDGEILTLERDVTVNGEKDADYKNSGTVTLDLNKHTITGKNNNIALRANAGNGTLKLTNGKIVADQGTYSTVGVANSTLELSDMELENVTAYGCSIKAFDGGTINLHEVNSKSTTGGGVTAAGGTVNVYNSTFTQEGEYDHNSVNLSASSGTGTVNVYSGTFTSENYGLYIFSSGGTINVYDGTFDADKAVLKVDLDLGSYQDAEAYVNISDGTFDGKLEIADKEGVHVQITGGTFTNTGLTKEQFSAYVPESALLTEGADGVFTVAKLDETNSVARVGDTYYRSLQAAINDAEAGDTVTLLKDTKEDIVIPKDAELALDLNSRALTNEDAVTPKEAALTLNLNGKTLTNVSGHTITNNGTLTITGDGTVDNVTHGKAALVNYGTAVVENVTLKRSQEAGTDADNNGGNSYYTLENYGVMTIEDGTTVENKGAYSSMVHNGWADGSKNTDGKNSVLTINGGTFNGGLNTIKNDDYGELTINDGTFENMSQATFLNWNIATVNGGTFNAENASSDVILNGYLDASMDQGELTINGGTFNAGKQNTVIATMNGAHSGDIEITGGTLNGSIVLTDSQDGAQLTITQDAKINGNVTNSGKADVAITDGATVSGQVSNGTNGTMSVVNSTVGSVPQDTTSDSIVIVNSYVDKVLTTNTEDKAIMVGGKTYDTMAGAIEAVGNGQTIYVLKDIPDAVGIAVPSSKNFTIDFGGHTYTLIGPGAGSSGTETNGFQLLKDSTITLKNGTIRIAEGANNIKRIIQNYANLTLEDMHIYAQNQQPDENYALSFNNGNITFKGDTDVITTSDETIAFDVCKFASYPSASVTFDESYTGTVNGRIVYDSTNAGTHTLTIQGNGTFGTIEAASGAGEAAKAGIEVTSGHFAKPVDKDYLAETVKAQLKSASNPDAPYSYYPSVEDAIAAAKPGDTVTAVNTEPDETTYTVTLKFNDGKTDNLTYEVSEGTAIDLPTPSRSGYTFEGWYDGNTRVSDPYNVTKTVTLTAEWDYKDDDHGSSSSGSSSSVRRYDIEADAGRGGDISPDGRVRVRRGEDQTFRITADDGWEIYDVEVDGESVGAVSRYTFENVRTDHTISATFRQTGAQTEEAQLPFLDVAEGAWYYDAVTYCYENGIMDGTSSVSFAPGMLLNRAMAAQVLYNLADGTASTAAGFPDVAASAWYADAVNWAAANGYVTGYDNGSFGPEDSLTREQLAVILYRYAGSPEPTGSLDGFTDAASASDYAVDALRWAVGEGLLTGKDGGRLDPAGTASRAELAQILARFAQM